VPATWEIARPAATRATRWRRWCPVRTPRPCWYWWRLAAPRRDRRSRRSAGETARVPRNSRARRNGCDNAVGGTRTRPRVIERNPTCMTLTRVKRASRSASRSASWAGRAPVLLALTRTTLGRDGDMCQEGERKHLVPPGPLANQAGAACCRRLTGQARSWNTRPHWPARTGRGQVSAVISAVISPSAVTMPERSPMPARSGRE
jgi:hypothetical protein